MQGSTPLRLDGAERSGDQAEDANMGPVLRHAIARPLLRRSSYGAALPPDELRSDA